MLDLQAGLSEEGLDQMRLLPQPTYSKVELLVQFLQVAAHQVAHLHILEVMPAPFVPRIQGGGVSPLPLVDPTPLLPTVPGGGRTREPLPPPPRRAAPPQTP